MFLLPHLFVKYNFFIGSHRRFWNPLLLGYVSYLRYGYSVLNTSKMLFLFNRALSVVRLISTLYSRLTYFFFDDLSEMSLSIHYLLRYFSRRYNYPFVCISYQPGILTNWHWFFTAVFKILRRRYSRFFDTYRARNFEIFFIHKLLKIYKLVTSRNGQRKVNSWYVNALYQKHNQHFVGVLSRKSRDADESSLPSYMSDLWRFFYVSRYFLLSKLPYLLFIFSNSSNSMLLGEIFSLSLPVCSVVDVDCELLSVTYPIVSNQKSFFLFFFLCFIFHYTSLKTHLNIFHSSF